MEKDFHREFTRCPVCTLREELANILGKPELILGDETAGFLQQLGQEMKDRKLARPNWKMCLDARSGGVIDEQMKASIPVGAEVPTFEFMTDICMDCGCVFATSIRRGDIKKPSQIAVPNRAERRRMEGPHTNNPNFS